MALLTQGRSRQSIAAALARFVERAGQITIDLIHGIYAFLRIIGETLAWIFAGPFYRQPVRFFSVANQIVELGFNALPLGLIFAVAFGLILGMQASNMQQAIDLLPDILGFLGKLLTREQAPLLVGVLIASRNGSAIASELSAMVAGTETAALRSMGIEPVRFLVAPALIAMLIVTPIHILIMIAATLSTVTIYLDLVKGVSPLFVVGLVVGGISPTDLIVSLSKGLVFAVLITGIAAAIGLSPHIRYRFVGRAVTSAIVAGVTSILIANAIISALTPW